MELQSKKNYIYEDLTENESIENIKFKKRVITKQTLEEFNIKKEQVELEYYQYNILATIWKDIIENSIYGIVP